MSDTKHITSIGGQAVMEGVMMRGPHKTAVAVRKPDGEIVQKIDEIGTKKKSFFAKLPIIRGCVNFFESMIIGIKALMYSAEFVDLEDDEPTQSKFETWLEDKLGDKIKDVVIYFSLIISVFMSVGLFILLPTLITDLIQKIPVANIKAFSSVCEGLVRMIIFISYLALVSQMKDIKRVFEYHGAEHKSIACYEAGEELTVENVKKHSRLHPRCGTSFLLFVMIVSIILFSLLPEKNIIIKLLMRLALLPVVAGISYEIIKFAGRSKNKCVMILQKPGLLLQKLTTREPDDSQIQVAIESIKSVIPEDKNDDKW